MSTEADREGHVVKLQLPIDGYEGEKKEFAVLVTEDGRQINFPRDLLPKGAKAGDLLSLTPGATWRPPGR